MLWLEMLETIPIQSHRPKETLEEKVESGRRSRCPACRQILRAKEEWFVRDDAPGERDARLVGEAEKR